MSRLEHALATLKTVRPTDAPSAEPEPDTPIVTIATASVRRGARLAARTNRHARNTPRCSNGDCKRAATDDYKQCRICRKSKRKHRRTEYHARLKANLCGICGKPSRDDANTCQACADRKHDAYKKISCGNTEQKVLTHEKPIA